MGAPFNTLSLYGLQLRTRELETQVFAQEFSELVSPYKYVTDERNTRRRSESPGRQLRKELSLGAVVVVVPRPSSAAAYVIKKIIPATKTSLRRRRQSQSAILRHIFRRERRNIPGRERDERG